MKNILKETLKVWGYIIATGAILMPVIAIPVLIIICFGFVVWTFIFSFLWISFWTSLLAVGLHYLQK